MKRYLLFAFEQWDDGGGWDHFAGSFDSVDEAKASYEKDEWEGNVNEGHVVDIESGGIVLLLGDWKSRRLSSVENL